MSAPIVFTLSPGQVDELARRVAEILAERAAPAPAPAAFVTLAEAAALLGVSAKTVRNMMGEKDGRLSRHGAPRRPLVARVEVEALAAGAGREKPTERVRRPDRPPREPSRTFTSRARGG